MFTWQGVGNKEATGVVSARRCNELPPVCQTEPIPDGSKTDPLLAKAGARSDTGTACVIERIKSAAQQLEESSEKI